MRMALQLSPQIFKLTCLVEVCDDGTNFPFGYKTSTVSVWSFHWSYKKNSAFLIQRLFLFALPCYFHPAEERYQEFPSKNVWWRFQQCKKFLSNKIIKKTSRDCRQHIFFQDFSKRADLSSHNSWHAVNVHKTMKHQPTLCCPMVVSYLLEKKRHNSTIFKCGTFASHRV